MITLTTDFGIKDTFVGMMKGVMLGIHPEATIVDLTHGIPRHDIKAAALALAEAYRFFPHGTTHVVVVDPGVGSTRRPIAASAHGHRFVGPDNGVLTGVIASDPRAHVFHLNQNEYFLEGAGRTFDGRDVFAPVAAWLDRGKTLSDVGEEITDHSTFDLPAPETVAGEIHGQVIYIDSFGNAITNIRALDLHELSGGESDIIIRIKDTEAGVVHCYSDGNCNLLHALINSAGLLELFLDRTSAADAMGLTIGDPVSVKLK